MSSRRRSTISPASPAGPFSTGSLVEVRSDEEGFKGSWFEARIVRSMPKLRRYTVEYQTLVSDADASCLLRETLDAVNVRPRPPRRAGPSGGFEVGHTVDAYWNDGWWAGVVSRVSGEGEERRFTVFFPVSKEELECSASDLRVQLEWVDGEWIQSQSQNVSAIDSTAYKQALGPCDVVHVTRIPVLDTMLNGVNGIPCESGSSAANLNSKVSDGSTSENTPGFSQLCKKSKIVGTVEDDIRLDKLFMEKSANSPAEVVAGFEITKPVIEKDTNLLIPPLSENPHCSKTPLKNRNAVSLDVTMNSSQNTLLGEINCEPLMPQNSRQEMLVEDLPACTTDPSIREEGSSMLVDRGCESELKAANSNQQSPNVNVRLKRKKLVLSRRGGKVPYSDESRKEKINRVEPHIACTIDLEEPSEDLNSKVLEKSDIAVERRYQSARKRGRPPKVGVMDTGVTLEGRELKKLERKEVVLEQERITVEVEMPSVNFDVSYETQPLLHLDGDLPGDIVVERRERSARKRGRPPKVGVVDTEVTLEGRELKKLEGKEVVLEQECITEEVEMPSVNFDVSYETQPLLHLDVEKGDLPGDIVVERRERSARKRGRPPKVRVTDTDVTLEGRALKKLEGKDVILEKECITEEVEMSSVNFDVSYETQPLHHLGGDLPGDNVYKVHPAIDDEDTIDEGKPSDEGYSAAEVERIVQEVLNTEVDSTTRPVALSVSVQLSETDKEAQSEAAMPSREKEPQTAEIEENTKIVQEVLNTGVDSYTRPVAMSVSVQPSETEKEAQSEAAIPSGEKESQTADIDEKTKVVERTKTVQEVLNMEVDSDTRPVAMSVSVQLNKAEKEAQSEAAMPAGDTEPKTAEIEERTQIDTLNSKETHWPFPKSLSMWKLIDSMEVFSSMPQQPHFRPLEQFFEELREGMAIGLMLTFSNLVDSVRKLQIVDSELNFKNKMKTIAHLEEHGFNVQHIRYLLEKLQKIKGNQVQFQGNISALEGQISEKENKRNDLCEKVDAIKKSIIEIEEQLNLLHDEGSSILKQMEDNDHEITKLKMDADAVGQSFLAAEDDFKGVLAAAW